MEYSYDYTNRRIRKRVWDKDGSGEIIGEPTAAVYVNKYYEVREHDQAVKYVFNGSTRIAKITGTLDARAERVQRQRLYRGWNLLSLAVEAPDAARQLGIGIDPNLPMAYRWDSEQRRFLSVGPEDALPAGTVLSVFATGETMLAVRGVYREPDRLAVSSRGHYRMASGLEALDLSHMLFPDSAELWVHEAATSAWRLRSRGNLSFLSEAPAILKPGQPIFIRSEQDLDLELPPSPERIQYYHPNHLGSTAILTDAQGRVTEETAYYPFGYPRNRHVNREGIVQPNYLFTQKELDPESGLMYCDARYYAGELGRYISVDPLIGLADPKQYQDPQSHNLYAYAHGNPVKYIDPSGEEIVVAGTKGFKMQVQTALRKIDPSISVDMKTGRVSYNESLRSLFKIKNTFIPKVMGVSGKEKGTQLMTRMIDSKHTVKIEKWHENEAGADNRDNAANPNKGSGGTVHWNPSSNYANLTLTKEGRIEYRPKPSFLALGHELIHGDHYQRGVLEKDTTEIEYEGMYGMKYKKSEEELRTVGLGGFNTAKDITENDLRREAGEDVGLRIY